MQRLIWTILASFVMAICFGPIVIPWLKKMKFGQTIYDLGPESHKKKQGVPTMGGVIFAVPALIAASIFFYKDNCEFISVCAICAIGFGAIGYIDDYIKVSKKRSLGLTPKQKLVPQIVISIAISVWAYMSKDIGSALKIPFTDIEWDLGWFYIPVMTFILVGTVNSSNLLDGLDGLLGGCSLFAFATMALVCVTMAIAADGSTNLFNTAIFAGAMVGAVMGFLRYNAHPAGVFMGDIGSFFIGGALVGITLVTRYSLLLLLIAPGMVASSLSDLIQFAYFRATHGKRIFKMAPLHHHFELSGFPETKIVAMYYIVTVLMCLVALLGFVG